MQKNPTATAAEAEQRPARPGERCTCGRPAIVVYDSITGWCGQPLAAPGPCPWCGRTDHLARCPSYRLRPDGAA